MHSRLFKLDNQYDYFYKVINNNIVFDNKKQ